MGNNASVAVQPGAGERPRSDFFTETFSSKLTVDPGSYYVDQNQKKLGGVGIVFALDENGVLIVYRLVKGGPAHLSGRVNHGDQLKSINGNIIVQTPGQKPNLSGWEGTTVKLGFSTGQSEEPYVVQLARDSRCYPDEMALVAPGFAALVETRTVNRNSGPPPLSPRASLPPQDLRYASLPPQSPGYPPSLQAVQGEQPWSTRAPVKSWTPGPTIGNPWTAHSHAGEDGGAPLASELFEWRYSQGSSSAREVPTTASAQKATPRVGGAAMVEELPLEKLPQARRDVMPPSFFASVKAGTMPASPAFESRPVSVQAPTRHSPSQNVFTSRPVSGGSASPRVLALKTSPAAAQGTPPSERAPSIREMSARILQQEPGLITEEGYI